MVTALRHTGLVVRNLDKSLAFYVGVLGLIPWKRSVEKGPFIESVVGISGVTLEWVKLKTTGGGLVELLQYHSHPDKVPLKNQSSNRIGCSHVAFTINNIDHLYIELIESGHSVISPPQKSPDGKVKVLYCHDPDGMILELVEELKE